MRIRLPISVIAILIGLLTLPSIVSGAKSYSADRFDVDVAVQDDGSLLVTETVIFRFNGGPFTYVFRDLPTDHTDGVTVVSASMDDQTLPPGKDAGQVEIRGRNPIKVRWHFAPTSDSSHTFVLVYRALGVIRVNPEADVLAWQALPDDYDYPIASSTITVTYPKAVQRIAAPRLRAGDASVETSAGQVRFVAQNLKPKSPFVLELSFAPGSVITQPPQWQARAAEANRVAPTLGLFTAALTLLGLGGVAAYLRRYGRPASSTAAVVRPTTPPSRLPPAIAGVIGSSAAAASGWNQALAALFDLAARGALRFEEAPDKKWYRQHDFIVQRQGQPAGLRPHEQAALDLVFSHKGQMLASVKLSDLQNRLTSRLGEFNKAIEQEMQDLGLLDPARRQVKRSLGIAAALLFGLLIVGLALGVLIAVNTGLWPVLLLLIAVFSMSMALFIASAGFSPLSEAGMVEHQQWKAFGDYLREVVKGRELFSEAATSSMFEANLPFAAGLGLLDRWVKFFQKEGALTIPTWFSSLSRAGDGSEIAIFATMMHSAGSVGGDASGAGAGAGAAGGGASGAG